MTLIIGSIGVTTTSSVMAQDSLEKMPRQIAQSSALTGSWRLANMTEPPFPTPMLPSTDITADFSGDRVTGSGGCNRFNGGFKTKGNQLTIDPLASTRKACEEGVMTQEARFLKALQTAQRYEVNDQGLQIFYKTEQGIGVLRFVSQTVRGLW
ncbi:META domain-containing protein [Leptolyngbyaceae cyanobacterium UHCC 1019]